jgi:hypothetical protein
MNRSMLALLLTLTAVGATAATASSGRGTASLCVGSKPGCFSAIQAAINTTGDRSSRLPEPTRRRGARSG